MNNRPYSKVPNKIQDLQSTNIPPTNRGLDTRFDGEEKPLEVTLHTIDSAIINYLDTRIVPMVSQDGTTFKVPVLYANAERWKSIVADGVYRDKFDKIQLPLVTLRRISMKQNSMNSAINRYNTYTFSTKYNRRNAYDKFSVLNGIVPSRQYYTTIIPDYYDITYEGIIWTEYVEQMNKITEAISFETEEYWGERNHYKFKTHVGEFTQEVDLPPIKDRIVRTKFIMVVKGYLLPEQALDRNNIKTPVTKIGYTPKKVVTFVEVVGTNENLDSTVVPSTGSV